MSDVKVLPIPVRMGPMTVMAYALVGDRVVIVDTGVGGQAERILERIAEEGHAPGDVSLILLTHGHGDHAGSAAALRDATGAPIALGDCFAAATAAAHGLVLLTGDPELIELPDALCAVEDLRAT